MLTVSVSSRDETYDSAITFGSVGTGSSAESVARWQALPPPSCSAGTIDLGESGVLLFRGGTQRLIISHGKAAYFLSMSATGPATSTPSELRHDRWIEMFENFLGNVPLVGHTVDSSRESIY